ncbi:Hypothetical protein, putative [Bodo saltans]|uniref:SAM domain-containing protein n=1 Tax=Bodo saltans TaxID=75058 RepID=A0A0S4INU2_BODSA|nr:Hypothetical protein, putative [Bodo saltans]|eukprot:CUF73834.1 Hypothetical protein, putative [Bodo saltans]
MPPKKASARATAKLNAADSGAGSSRQSTSISRHVGGASTVLPPSEASHVNPVSAFLASLQLQGYSEAMVSQHGFRTLEALATHIHDEKDLLEIGILPLAHRRVIMAAIQKNRRSWLAVAAERLNAQTRNMSTTIDTAVQRLSNAPSRGTVCLDTRLSFGQQLERFKLGNHYLGQGCSMQQQVDAMIHAEPDVVTEVNEGPLPTRAGDPTVPGTMIMLSGNSATAFSPSQPTIAAHHLANDSHLPQSRTIVEFLKSHQQEEEQAQCVDTIAAVVMEVEDVYSSAMATMLDDARAAAATLTHFFQQRSADAETRRQECLREAAALASEICGGIDTNMILDKVAVRVANRQDNVTDDRSIHTLVRAPASSLISGWTFSVRLTPTFTSTTHESTPVAVVAAHEPLLMNPSNDILPVLLSLQASERNDEHVVPLSAAKATHDINSSPNDHSGAIDVPGGAVDGTPKRPARMSARRSSGSAVRSMRHSIRCVEHWLNDDAVISQPTPSTLDVPVFEMRATRSTAVSSSSSVGFSQARAAAVGVQDLPIIDAVPAKFEEKGQTAADNTDPAQSHNQSDAINDHVDHGSVVDMINDHISCSQHIAPQQRLHDAAAAAPMNRWAHVPPQDIVDVDEVSSCCTSVSAALPPLTTVGGGGCDEDEDHHAMMMVPPTHHTKVSSHRDEAIDADEVSSGGFDDDFNDDEVQAGEEYDRFGAMEMGEEHFFCGDELFGRSSSSTSQQTTANQSVAAAIAISEVGDDTMLLFEDEDEAHPPKLPLGDVSLNSSGLPPLGPPSLRSKAVMLGPTTSHYAVSAPPASGSRVASAFKNTHSSAMFHRRHSRAEVELLEHSDVVRLCAVSGIALQHGNKRPRDESIANAKEQLRLLHTRSLFTDRVQQLFASSLPSFEGDQDHHQRSSSREASLGRLQQAEKQALTQAELNDVRRRIREVEATDAKKSLLLSLAHHSMEQTLCRAHQLSTPHDNEDEAASSRLNPFTPYEAMLLGEGVDLDVVQNVVRKEFPAMTKSRVEAALKLSGVPINIAKDSPKELNRRRFFTRGWTGKRGGRQK